MTSTRQHGISRIRPRTASVVLLAVSIVVVATTLAARLARAAHPSHTTQSFGAMRSVPQSWTLTTLYTFTGGADGGNPRGVIRDGAGNLYGATSESSGAGQGVVFKVDPAGNETVLYTFTRAVDGVYPLDGLLRDAAGNLYGTTYLGGEFNCEAPEKGCGVVFKLDTSGNYTVLYAFPNGDGGGRPWAGVIQDAAGNLYGTTSRGGAYDDGIVFKLNTAGNETVLHAFSGADGGSCFTGLIHDGAGNLYGTTNEGGLNYGVTFKLDKAGTETVLHSFTGGSDGAYPSGGLIRDSAGNLYGATSQGGSFHNGVGHGVVFELDSTGNETILYSFTGGTDGSDPVGSLVSDGAGNLYGVAGAGGHGCSSGGCGVIFKLDPNGNETVLYSFTSGTYPNGGLIRDPAGNFYGTTYTGGDSKFGTVFKLTPP